MFSNGFSRWCDSMDDKIKVLIDNEYIWWIHICSSQLIWLSYLCYMQCCAALSCESVRNWSKVQMMFIGDLFYEVWGCYASSNHLNLDWHPAAIKQMSYICRRTFLIFCIYQSKYPRRISIFSMGGAWMNTVKLNSARVTLRVV